MPTIDDILIAIGINDETGPGSKTVKGALTKISDGALALGKTMGSALAFGPGFAAAASAAGGFAAAFSAAGVAAVAFGAAAGPQLSAVSDVTNLHAAAMEAQAAGGKEAAAAMDAYKGALEELPPATQDTATALVGLKGDFNAWSDSLSGDVMPVFTSGIGVLGDLLPTLTPFVRDAANAFGGFIDTIGADIKSEGFATFMSDMQLAAKETLPDLLESAKNLIIGFAGIVGAFLPMSGEMSGGLVDLTARFAEFGMGLGDSAGFQTFLDLAATGSATFGALGTAALALATALAPVFSVTSQIAIGFANMLAALPPDVLMVLVTVILVITSALRVWAVVQGILNLVMLMNPIILIVTLIVALIAIIVLIATKTTWFQDLWSAVWGGIKAAAKAVADWWTGSFWPGLQRVFSAIGNAASSTKDAIVDGFDAVVSFVKNLPGKIASAASGMWDSISGGFKSAINAIISGWNGLSFTVPSVDLGPLGSIGGFTLSMPNIPLLAEGAIVTGPTLAVVGEGRHDEAVVPLPRGAREAFGGGGRTSRLEIDLTGDEDLVRMFRRGLRARGGLDVVFTGAS